MSARDRIAGPVALIATLAGLYAVAVLLGFATLVILFKLGVLSGITVLFFRGLVLSGLVFVALIALGAAAAARWRSPRIGARDAFSAAVLSLSFNVCFLVVVPVTTDRSISVFVLGEMNAAPDRVFTPAAMSQLFTSVYVGDYAQIDRRLHEQAITGNVEPVGDGYRISARGRLFIRTAQLVVWLFGGDARLATPPRRPSNR